MLRLEFFVSTLYTKIPTRIRNKYARYTARLPGVIKEKILIKKVNIETPKIHPAGIKTSSLSIEVVLRKMIIPATNSGAKYNSSSNQNCSV